MGNRKSFLVPYDFTEASKKALDQTIELSKYDNSKVIMLHVISKDSERDSASKKIKTNAGIRIAGRNNKNMINFPIQ